MLVLIYVGLHIRVNEQFFTITKKMITIFLLTRTNHKLKKMYFVFKPGAKNCFGEPNEKKSAKKTPFYDDTSMHMELVETKLKC